MISIVDDTTWRNYRNHLDTVLVRTGLIVLIGDDLKIVEVAEKHHYHKNGNADTDEDSGDKYAVFKFLISIFF